MARPNFIVLGASKCGTTSLHRYLQQHPQIFMSAPKEPHFLVYAGYSIQSHTPVASQAPEPEHAVKTLDAYEALFAGRQNTAIALGEASTSYLAFPMQVIPAIKKYLPRARLIAILRQPAERAFSAYLHHVRSGRQPTMDFRRVYEEEKQNGHFSDTANDLGDFYKNFYFKHGFYCAHLSHYYQAFPRQQIKVFLFDDLKSDPQTVLRNIFLHLGVDDTFKPDASERHNTAAWPRSRAFSRFLHIDKMAPAWLCRGWGIRERLKQLNFKPPPRLDPVLRQQLTDHYRQDILQLQDLIGRDLSHWLEPAGQF